MLGRDGRARAREEGGRRTGWEGAREAGDASLRACNDCGAIGEEEGGRTRVLGLLSLTLPLLNTRLRGDNEARAQLRATPRR